MINYYRVTGFLSILASASITICLAACLAASLVPKPTPEADPTSTPAATVTKVPITSPTPSNGIRPICKLKLPDGPGGYLYKGISDSTGTPAVLTPNCSVIGNVVLSGPKGAVESRYGGNVRGS